MALQAGTRVGAYEILSPLGAGGMGEVYRARDTKLQRDVALKILPETMARDAQRMGRFEREAQVLASLNHPNIAAIYGLEESNGVRALVMELVEGQTLAERIGRPDASVAPGFSPAQSHNASLKAGAATGQGRSGVGEGSALPREPKGLPYDEALPIAKQITEALEYAHERGVIHRDLKPANVKITPEGTVKVLDFGLAKVLEAQDPTATIDMANSPTLSAMATQAGMILGTAAYMSPEQAKGQRVDRRADIWAFGCVVYEMLSGRKPFEGETISDVLAAVIRAEPEWAAIPETTPLSIQRLVRRCLNKDPKQRLRDIGEARIAIEETISGADIVAPGVSPSDADHRSPLRRALPWALTGLLAGALITGLVVWKFVAPASQSSTHFGAVTNFAGVQAEPALSPDGRSVAFVSNRDRSYNIYVGLVQGGELVQITHDPNLKSRPCWSPDGTTIGYAQLNHSGVWDIWEVPALGGTPRRVILGAMDPAWSPDGHSLAYENMADGTLWISGISGENARQAAAVQQPWLEDTEPRFSPDGRQLAFIPRSKGPYGQLDVVEIASGKVRQLTHDFVLVLSPSWSPDGRFIYFASSRGGTMNIWKISATGGEPEQITSGQGDDAELDVSSDGKRIVFSTWRGNVNVAQLDLAAKPGERTVKILTTDPARDQVAPVYSPDGKHLAYFSNLKGIEKEGAWVADADGSNPVQLVRDSRINIHPRWTPDSKHLIYFSEMGPALLSDYRSVPISGGAPQTIFKNATDPDFDVGPDGRLLFRDLKGQVKAFDPRENKTETVATLPANEKWRVLRWFPDGRSIAYIVDPSREDDPNSGLWVDDFRSPPRQIFRGWVDWYARGPANELYVLEGKPDLNGVLWKVGWNRQGPTLIRSAIPLSNSYWVKLGRNAQDDFDVSPDGRHLAFDTQTVLQANIGMIESVR